MISCHFTISCHFLNFMFACQTGWAFQSSDFLFLEHAKLYTLLFARLVGLPWPSGIPSLDPPIFVSFSSSSNTVSSSSNDALTAAPSRPNTYLDNISSPLIQEDGDNKLLKLRFDVSQYQPEEIVVKTVDNKLLVS